MKLKSCPFCNNEITDIQGDPDTEIFIECEDCHIQMGIDPGMIQEDIHNLMTKTLVSKWNNRKKP